jgi:hypothetical protein
LFLPPTVVTLSDSSTARRRACPALHAHRLERYFDRLAAEYARLEPPQPGGAIPERASSARE